MATSITIPMTDLMPDHEELIQAAEDATRAAYDPDRFDGAHLVGAALQTRDGDRYTGVSVPTQIGRASVCAEPVAIGTAIDHGATDFDVIVAVGHPRPEKDEEEYTVIPPCGVCREMIADYGEDITVLVPVGETVRAVEAIDLLPTRTW